MSKNNIRALGVMGRVVIPRDACRRLGIKQGDPLEVIVNEDDRTITLKPAASFDPLSHLTDAAIYSEAIKRGLIAQ